MKNTNAKVMLVTLLFMAVQCVWAQTYLTDTYKPSESQHYKAYPTTGDEVMLIAVYKYKGGFTLGSGRGGLVSSNTPGYVVFDLPAGYDKLSFVVGPDSPNSASDKYNAILTVKADGNRVLDQVIWEHDAPQECPVEL